MPLNIRDPRAAALARELAKRRGTTVTRAIISALWAEIERERPCRWRSACSPSRPSRRPAPGRSAGCRPRTRATRCGGLRPWSRAAVAAFARHGKGRGHPARLDLADCLVYAAARLASAPLLFIGDDFNCTDIVSVLEDPRPLPA